MQAFVARLTAALLFIHTVCGCCWHHAHASEHRAAAAQTATCCHHHQHEGGDGEHQKPGKCKSECQGKCSYVVPPKVQIEAPQFLAIDLNAVLPSLADDSLAAASSGPAFAFPLDLAPPLRTHLLHQVLLN